MSLALSGCFILVACGGGGGGSAPAAEVNFSYPPLGAVLESASRPTSENPIVMRAAYATEKGSVLVRQHLGAVIGRAASDPALTGFSFQYDPNGGVTKPVNVDPPQSLQKFESAVQVGPFTLNSSITSFDSVTLPPIPEGQGVISSAVPPTTIAFSAIYSSPVSGSSYQIESFVRHESGDPTKWFSRVIEVEILNGEAVMTLIDFYSTFMEGGQEAEDPMISTLEPLLDVKGGMGKFTINRSAFSAPVQSSRGQGNIDPNWPFRKELSEWFASSQPDQNALRRQFAESFRFAMATSLGAGVIAAIIFPPGALLGAAAFTIGTGVATFFTDFISSTGTAGLDAVAQYPALDDGSQVRFDLDPCKRRTIWGCFSE